MSGSGGSPVRSAIIACLAVALLFVFPVPAGAQASGSWASFGADAEAAGLAFKVVYSGFAGLFPIVDASVAHVRGTLDSRPDARGYASGADPGQAIQSLPALGVPVPAYPWQARAEFPGGTPRSHTSAFEQAAGPGTARLVMSDVAASSGPRLEASALAGAFDAPGVLSAGSVGARTTMRADGDLVIATTEVVVKDVTIAGALHIGAVHTTVQAIAGGAAGTAKAEPHIQLVDVSLAGQQATVDDQGVHLAGQAVPGGLIAPPADPLAQAGVAVSLGGVTGDAAADGTSAVAGAAGLVMQLSAPDGSVVIYRIGWAAAAVSATLAQVSPPPPAVEIAPPPQQIVPIPPALVPSPAPAVGPTAPSVRAQRFVMRPVKLPRNLLGLVALAQIVFWGTVGALGWWARPQPAGGGREWLFDTIDRIGSSGR